MGAMVNLAWVAVRQAQLLRGQRRAGRSAGGIRCSGAHLLEASQPHADASGDLAGRANPHDRLLARRSRHRRFVAALRSERHRVRTLLLNALLTVAASPCGCNNMIRIPEIATLIGLLVGTLVGTVLCRFCRRFAGKDRSPMANGKPPCGQQKCDGGLRT